MHNLSEESSSLSDEFMDVPSSQIKDKKDIQNVGLKLCRRIHKIKKFKKKGVIQAIDAYFNEYIEDTPKKLPKIRRVKIQPKKTKKRCSLVSKRPRVKDFIQGKLKKKFGLLKIDRNKKLLKDFDKSLKNKLKNEKLSQSPLHKSNQGGMSLNPGGLNLSNTLEINKPRHSSVIKRTECSYCKEMNKSDEISHRSS
ncbi:unnamed protein product [Moneuplotes crassus]|uniref:Uncharacterized protein n=1 Tax=Euplotes crassus TaxID=5936 RepID=A0AAD1UBH0_EUPCR|nr:unnamed protein product [Moneuplotes crassus]